MKTLTHTLIAATFAVSSMSVFAEEGMKKEGAMMKAPTMQDCKAHMAMAEKDAMKKDDDMAKKCTAMMKQHDATMKKDDPMMKKDGSATGQPKN